MDEQSLKDKTVKGVSWSAIDNFAGSGIMFLVGLVLARLLSPTEYGLIGIILIFIYVFNTIADSGFSKALIRKNKATDIDYNTVFFTNIILSVFLYFILFLLSPYVALFFKEPQLDLLLKVCGIIVIIDGFAIVQRTILIKLVDFKTQAKVSLFASLASGVIGIAMAYKGFGVWALVGQQISRQSFNTMLLWFFGGWKPSFYYSKSSLQEMWTFGWKLLASNLIDTAWRQTYQVVIGKFYTPYSLGLYTRAAQFGSIFSSNLTSVIQRVTYPVLSSIQDDKVRLKAAYQRVIKLSMFLSCVLMLGMAACAKSMIVTLIGEQWLDCVPMLQILCFTLSLYPLHAINLNMLQVQGRSDLFLRLEIIKKFVAVIPIIVGIFVDIYWMLIMGIFVGSFGYYLNAYYSGPFLNYSVKDQVKDVIPSYCVGISMAIPVYLLNYIHIHAYYLFPLQVIVGAFITIIICEKIKFQEYIEIKELLMFYIKKWIYNIKIYYAPFFSDRQPN